PDVLANPRGELVDHLTPGVLRRAFDEIVPAYDDFGLPLVADKTRAQVLSMDVDVVSDALADEQPDHVGREVERAVLRERAVQSDNHGMGQDVCHQPTVIARTSFDGGRCFGLPGFEPGQLLPEVLQPLVASIPSCGDNALAPIEFLK